MPKRIGLIYREDKIGELVKLVLEPNGYTIIDYGPPEVAMSDIKNNPPELILILNSWFLKEEYNYSPKIVKAIRQLWPREKVAIISCHGREDVPKDPGDVFTCVTKPFDLDELIVAVKGALETWGAG